MSGPDWQVYANLYGRLRDRLDDLAQVLDDWHMISRDQFIEVFTENNDADLLPESLTTEATP